MSHWEYCAVVGLSRYDVELQPGQPAVWFFTPGGVEIVKLNADYRREGVEVARAIAELGDTGWEMVGCANTSPYHFMVFFKRPKELLVET